MSSQRSKSPVRILPVSLAALSLAGCIFGSGSAPDPEAFQPYEASPEEQLEAATDVQLSPGDVRSEDSASTRPGPAMAAGDRTQQERRWGDPYWKPGDPGPGPGLLSTGPARNRYSDVPIEVGWVRQHDWVGDGSAETEPFRVESAWKLVWRSGDRPSDEPLRMEVYRESDGVLMARVTQDGPSEISSLQLPEPGSYFVRINGGGGQWFVAVEVPSTSRP